MANNAWVKVITQQVLFISNYLSPTKHLKPEDQKETWRNERVFLMLRPYLTILLVAIIRAFRAYRPIPSHAALIVSPPYDVINRAEAAELVQDRPLSFLRVIKPEVDFPENHDPYDEAIYLKGRENMHALIDQGLFHQDEAESLYIYRLEMGPVQQSGIVALASVADYEQGIIKKHELTRPPKEEDRRKHVRVSQMNYEPVFFAYRAVPALDQIVADIESHAPNYDFTTSDGIRHILWQVADQATIAHIVDLFGKEVPCTYVADGHHRTAAAAGVGQEMAQANPNHTGEEPYNYFLAVHFPHDQLQIIDYNRVVSTLNDLTPEELLEKLAEHFDISPQTEAYKPQQLHELAMYLAGTWYKMVAKPATYEGADLIGTLDVTILSDYVLAPHFGITDLRRDQRIDFVGGIRGLSALEQRVDSEQAAVAFALYPVSMEQLMAISDHDLIMPPKTTWFEPKLRSGLLAYRFGL